MAGPPLRQNPTGNAAEDDRARSLVEDLRQALAAPFLRGHLFASLRLPGLRGRVQSVSGSTLTLCNAADADNFVVFASGTSGPPAGSIVEAASTDGSSGGAKHTGQVQIASIDRAGGVLTASAPWSTISGIAAGDYLFGAKEFGPPVKQTGNTGRPTYVSGSVLRVRYATTRDGGTNSSSVGWLVLRTTGPRPAQIRSLYSDREWLYLESREATTVDLWVY